MAYKQLSDYRFKNARVERSLIKFMIKQPKECKRFLKLVPIVAIEDSVFC